jgi:hypothetical protein
MTPTRLNVGVDVELRSLRSVAPMSYIDDKGTSSELQAVQLIRRCLIRIRLLVQPANMPQPSACCSTAKVSAAKPKAAAEAYKGVSVSWTVGSIWKRKTAAADTIVSINADVHGISRKVSKSSC